MPVGIDYHDYTDTSYAKEQDGYVKRSTEEKKRLILEEIDTFINAFQSLGDLSVLIVNEGPIAYISVKRSSLKNGEQEGIGRVREDGYQSTFSISARETSQIANSILDRFNDENIEQSMGRKGKDKAEFKLSYPEGKITISIDANEGTQELVGRLSCLEKKVAQKQNKSNRDIQEK